MIVLINGHRTQFPDRATVADAISHLDLGEDGIAVAVNYTVIPRDDWSKSSLTENDTVTIIHPVQGG